MNNFRVSFVRYDDGIYSTAFCRNYFRTLAQAQGYADKMMDSCSHGIHGSNISEILIHERVDERWVEV